MVTELLVVVLKLAGVTLGQVDGLVDRVTGLSLIHISEPTRLA